ncbi:uncharacterized protein LOC124373545 [Homalodisca vitripennis]|uniref:uncharacterized protein LOC124373545 n=1 Tax=Homalodisca vitripennis TaxID=197043 RepID=UPI001EECE8A2|nr:uncharacterized protein LOC124373545 [Homalodisca vitripennis]
MELNVSKCEVVSFSHSQFPYIFDYRINGLVLRGMNSVKDLGVVFTSTLDPLEPIDGVVSRAYSLLGFIMRSTRSFRSPQSLLILYKSLVRPVLEYGSVIWSPHLITHIDYLDRAQLRFLRVLGVRMGYGYLTTPIEELELRFNLHPLHTRRQLQDLQLLYKLVNGKLDCPDLLRQVNFYIPRETRSKAVFGRVYRPTSYASNCGLARMQRTGGLVCAGLDFFRGSWLSFKWRCSRVLT